MPVNTDNRDPTPDALEILRVLLVKFKCICEQSNMWPGRPQTGMWEGVLEVVEEWNDPEYTGHAWPSQEICVWSIDGLMEIAWHLEQIRRPDPKWHFESWYEMVAYKGWKDFWGIWIGSITNNLAIQLMPQAREWGVPNLGFDWGEYATLEMHTAGKKRFQSFIDWCDKLLVSWRPPTRTVLRPMMAVSVETAIVGLTEILASDNCSMPVDHEQCAESVGYRRRPGRHPDPQRSEILAMIEVLRASNSSWATITEAINTQYKRGFAMATLQKYLYSYGREQQEQNRQGNEPE